MSTRNEDFEINRVVQGDCVSGMAGMPDRLVDLVITDPPFAIDFKAQRAR